MTDNVPVYGILSYAQPNIYLRCPTASEPAVNCQYGMRTQERFNFESIPYDATGTARKFFIQSTVFNNYLTFNKNTNGTYAVAFQDTKTRESIFRLVPIGYTYHETMMLAYYIESEEYPGKYLYIRADNVVGPSESGVGATAVATTLDSHTTFLIVTEFVPGTSS